MTSFAVVPASDEFAPSEEEYLRSFEARLHEVERSLDTAARHALGGGAKRARPLLAYRFARVASAPTSRLLDAAVALELVHTASLVHDDIIDDANQRRGLATVQARWGSPEAVLTGDVLLCRSLVLLSAMPLELKRTAEVFQEMCEAARNEYFSRKRTDLSVPAWEAIAEGKTGALFGLAAYFGGSLGGDLERARRFELAARNIGVAFQIADDVSDLARTGSGDDGFTDLRDGNPSLPIALSLARDPGLTDRLERLWANSNPDPMDLAPLARAVLTRDVCEEARAMLRHRLTEAVTVLGDDAAHPALRLVVAWGAQLAVDLDGLLTTYDRKAVAS